MKILLIHQNFPAQFKHLGPALAERGDQIVVLTPKVKEATKWKGITVLPYAVKGSTTQGIHPWLADFETKLLRGTSCYDAALALKKRGFDPDVILAHHGWGESLFLKDVWPDARLGLDCELHHRPGQAETGRDPARLASLTFDAAVDLLALGLDPNRAVLFVQSDVPEVSELFAPRGPFFVIVSPPSPLRGHGLESRAQRSSGRPNPSPSP